MMPTTTHNYVIRERDGKFCVLTEDESRVLGCHDTKEEALAQLRAIEASKHAGTDLPYFVFNEDGLYEIRNVEIFKSGTWNGDPYSEQDLQDMVDAAPQVGFIPPMKRGHTSDTGAPALGWVQNLRRVGEKLIADLTALPRQVYDAIRQRSFGPISAEIYWDFERNGSVFRRVLKAVSLLGAEIPAVAGLKPAWDSMGTSFGAVKTYDTEMRVIPMAEATISLEQMQVICPSCAEKMKSYNFKVLKIPRAADGTYQIGNMPPQMLEGLCEKFGAAEGFRTRCMEGISTEIDDPGAFCNALKEHCVGLAERQTAKSATAKEEVATMAMHKVVERDGKWCVVGENDESMGCFDTKEEAEAKAGTATMAVNPPVVAPQMDGVITQLQADLGLKAEDLQALKKRLIGEGFVDRKDYEALREQLTDRDKKETDRREQDRQKQVKSFSDSILSPVYRKFLTPVYDRLTGGPKVVTFSRGDGKEEQAEVAALLEEFGQLLNRQTQRLFGELAVADISRPERPADSNAREEVAKRTHEYAKTHSLDPIKDADKILQVVLDQDPVLKEAYFRS